MGLRLLVLWYAMGSFSQNKQELELKGPTFLAPSSQHLSGSANSKSLLQAKAKTKVKGMQVPIVQTVGLANVTDPTAFPPPPPTLNPVTDYQPLDTAIGDLVQKAFVEAPTVTPPPLQSALSLMFACPLLLLPNRFSVSAPTGCGTTPDAEGVAVQGNRGDWKSSDGTELLTWSEAEYSTSEINLKYTMPNGDGFGTSVQELSLGHTRIDFIDCGLNVLYFMTETVFKAPNQLDHKACKKYGLCDGSIFFKYEIWEQGGGMVAVSSLVPIFADEFSLSDAATSNELVAVSRQGAWEPRKCSDPPIRKEWTVSTKTGTLAVDNKRWVLGMALTVMSMRDEERSMDGLVRMTTTEAWTWGLLALLVVGGACGVVVLSQLFNYFLREKVTRGCMQLEDTIFPLTMYKNKYYT